MRKTKQSSGREEVGWVGGYFCVLGRAGAWRGNSEGDDMNSAKAGPGRGWETEPSWLGGCNDLDCDPQ